MLDSYELVKFGYTRAFDYACLDEWAFVSHSQMSNVPIARIS
jgi:hypothetical protein